jgi:hypothetical protein
VIKLHEGRHTNASLQRGAAGDPEIRRKSLGHADAAMTSHYTHIEAEQYRAATKAVAKLVEGRHDAHECSQDVPIRAKTPRRGIRRSGPGHRPPGKDAGGGGGRESNPPATRHAALWF